jgi:aryl-alcohol dehydrogenase-like predicted oxidoreductase
MTKRKLGNSGIEITPLAFGGNVFGWTVDEPTAFGILDAFVEGGGNFIDTADTYSRWVPGHQGGESEAIIGSWMKQRGNRKDVVIATKVGSEMGPNKKGLSRVYITAAVEDSLHRLQTDYIDLYQSHKDDPDTPLEETLGTYADLIKQGKVRAVGASNYTATRLSEALRISERRGYPKYESLQPRYNLYDRKDYEQALEPLCRDAGLGVITYYSLASGFLTGKYRSPDDLSKSVRGQNARIYMNARGSRILNALDKVARRHHTAPATIALAWLMARPGITAPIASATSVLQLADLIKAMTLELDGSSRDMLDRASIDRAAAA